MRLLSALLEVFDQRKLPIADLLEGIPYTEETLRTSRGNIEWQEAVDIFDRAEKAVGGRDAMRRLGHDIVWAPTFKNIALVMSHLEDTWQLFRVLRLWVAPLIIPAVPRHHQELPTGEIILSFSPDVRAETAASYFAMITGIMEHLPSFIGAPDAQIELDMEPTISTYTIIPPPTEPRTPPPTRNDPSTALARAAIHELIFQQYATQATIGRLNTTIDWLQKRSERLASFGQLGQSMAEKRDSSSLAHIILGVMVRNIGFSGGVLEINASHHETRRWGMGERPGPSELTYPFSSAPTFRGTLELWGPPPYEIGSSEDPVIHIIPWLVVALANAIAFENLDEEHERSEARLRQLEVARGQIEAREEKYRLLVEEATDAIVMVEFKTGRILEVNQALMTMLGYTRDELLSMTMLDLFRPEDLERRPLQLYKLDDRETVQSTRIVLTRTGTQVLLEMGIKKTGENLVQVIGRDITQWQRTRERLRESEERYALAVQGANDGLWDWDLRSGHLYFSPRWKKILGFDEDEIGNSPDDWFNRIHDDDRQIVGNALREHLQGHTEHFVAEHRIRHKDDRWIWVLARGLAVRDTHQKAYRMAGSLTETTERKQFERRLYHSAYHDSLTQLPNRAWVMQWLQSALDDPQGDDFAVLYFDLDRFKVINDSLGHIVGDKILKRIAGRLEQSLNDTAHIARIGGDEFVVLMPTLAHPRDDEETAMRIIEAVSTPMVERESELVLACSVGITHRNLDDYHTPEDILRDADLAMYAAKAGGGDRFEHFRRELHATAMENMQMEIQLRRAIESDELELAFQPIIEGATGEMIAVEALTRWPQKDGTSIRPSTFIPLAEETGLIHPLGRWVLRRATEQVLRWRALQPNLKVSVNISPRQFAHDNLVEDVRTLIDTLDLPPNMLALEITENALIDGSEASIKRLTRLREAGALIYIDDFGTGYSSLSYLVRLPFDTIKIDRSFVVGMEHDDTKQKIVRSVLGLTLSLDAQAVIEGIENDRVKNAILEFSPGVALQGNHFCAAAPAEEIEAMLKARTRFFDPAARNTSTRKKPSRP